MVLTGHFFYFFIFATYCLFAMKNQKKIGRIYFSGSSHNFFMKPFARHSLAIKLWRRSVFNSKYSFSGTKIVAPDKQAYIRYPKNENAFQVEQGK